MIRVISNLISKLGLMSNKMVPSPATNLLDPPSQVRGMTKWQPELFEKSVILPHVDLPTKNIGWSNKSSTGNVFAILKDFKIKIPNFKSVVDVSDNDAIKRVILDPKMYEKMSEKDKNDIRESYDGTFGEGKHALNYSNYTPSEALKYILPEDMEGLSSSQIVGHISYVQVRDHLLPYKEVIGQVMLNFSPRTKLVVTKTNTIDNKFRNLDLEILAGDPSLGFDVTVRENACSFKLDFSKVYWNPRLSTEHERIVDLVKRGDIVFDVFAGVGPFAIPLGKKGQVTKKNPTPITVYANDLNPSSYDYLKKNIRLNKLKEDHFHTYNLDGGEFIKSIFPSVLLKYYQDPLESQDLHVLMNLPALAVTFLPNFMNLVAENDVDIVNNWTKKPPPLIHVYSFSKDGTDLAEKCCEMLQVEEIQDLTVKFVRDVAPQKEMYRITFPLQLKFVLKTSESNEQEQPSAKKPKISDTVV